MESDKQVLDFEISECRDKEIILSYLYRKKKTTNKSNSWLLYCLGVTDDKPNGFLRVKGVSLPDIDLDICKRDRHKVVQYLIEKYGSDKLAQIGTYAVFKPRGALKAFARVCGHEPSVGHQLAAMVPPDVAGKQITFSELKDYTPALFQTEYQDVVDLAMRAEGIKNQAGIHAAGVIIADRSISDLVPLFRGKHDEIATQFDMHDTEELGLIKIDLLGLKTLTVIKDTLDLIKQNKGIDINLSELEDGDKATYNTFKTGNLTGIFQFETSGGFKDLCMQVKPDNINDLSSVTSIFRPGPLACGLAQKYIDGRNGKPVEYLIPELEPILRDMYGCMIFQESVMKICTDIAGYSLSDADNMRKVIGKKLSDKMKLERDKFVNGCIKNGISETKASLLFDDIDGYSSYSFNKSHGVSYSVISYRTAWLKTHYPLEFYTALLNNSDTQDDIVKYIYAAKQEGINISPPDINYSKQRFSLHNESIVYGLSGIKGIGEKACDKIIEQKPVEGYREIEDLIQRGIQKDNIVALAKAGALDSFDINRLQIVNSIDAQCEYYRKYAAWKERRDRYLAREEEIADAVSKGNRPPRRLPKLPPAPEKPEIPNIEYVSKDVYTSMEWESLNIYLTSHPLDSINAKGLHTIDMIKSGALEDGTIFNVLAVITSISEKRSRSGKNYAVCILEDRTSRCECTIFAKSWDKLKGNIEAPMVCFVKGRANKDSDDNDSQVVKLSVFEVDKVQTIELPGKIDLKLRDGTIFSFMRTESTALENWKSAITYADGLKEMRL